MNNSTQRNLHPLILVAAVSLTVFSLLASAAITGLLPMVRHVPETTDMKRSTTGDTVQAQTDTEAAWNIYQRSLPQFAVSDPVRVADSGTSRI